MPDHDGTVAQEASQPRQHTNNKGHFAVGALVTIRSRAGFAWFEHETSEFLISIARVKEVEPAGARTGRKICIESFRPFQGLARTEMTFYDSNKFPPDGIHQSTPEDISAHERKVKELRGRLVGAGTTVYNWTGPDNCNHPQSEKVFRVASGPPESRSYNSPDVGHDKDLEIIQETRVKMYCCHGKKHYAEITDLKATNPGLHQTVMYSDASQHTQDAHTALNAHIWSDEKRTEGVVFGFVGIDAAEMAKSFAVTTLHVCVDVDGQAPSQTLLNAIVEQRHILVVTYPVGGDLKSKAPFTKAWCHRAVLIRL
ncbi:MAG: hypothetical protein M1823_003813 [Watsoniomyces obsoletus]|nr:MAG: hypothetical protein M1823_003813 [Watsoniomyces obsoletus]